VSTFEFGDDPSERSLPGDVGLSRIDDDGQQQRRDTVAAGISDQAAQLALQRSWSMRCQPVSEICVRVRLRLTAAVSGEVCEPPRPFGRSACSCPSAST
jgi:hypothetical protein